MVKRGNNKHGGKWIVDTLTARGKRFRERGRELLHKKNLVGTHFIRSADWNHVDKQTDVRLYTHVGTGEPLNPETAQEMYETMVRVREKDLALSIQLFTAKNEIVRENLFLGGPESPPQEDVL